MIAAELERRTALGVGGCAAAGGGASSLSDDDISFGFFIAERSGARIARAAPGRGCLGEIGPSGMRTLFLIVALAPAAAALRVPLNAVAQPVQQAVASAALAALLVAGPAQPALADTSLEAAINEVNEATYPFIKAQKQETWQPFESKLLDTLLLAKPSALSATIDSGIDVFLSLPPAKIQALNDVVKTAAATAKLTDSCSAVVPSPAPAALVKRLAASEAVQGASPEKIKAFGDAAGPALKAVGQVAAGDSICLPPVSELNKLSLLQIDVIQSVDVAKGKEFDKLSQAAAKTIPAAKLGGLLPDARKIPGIKTAANSEELKQQQRLKAAVGELNNKVKKIIQDKVRFG